MWTVTTLVDRKEKPILKPVSAYDIDKYFGMLVDMYKEDAVLMTMVDYTTRKVRDLKVANRMDLNADDTIRLADKCLKYEEDMASLTTAVKGQLRVKLDLADWELNNAIRDALEEVKKLRQVNDDDTQHRFASFVNNYVDGSYADQLTDEGRLANLIARRVENVKAFKESFLANLDDKAAHCAQMLKMAYSGKIVDVKKAQEAIAATLRAMINRVYFAEGAGNQKEIAACKVNLGNLMVNGRLFTDELRYDISRRAPGRDEIKLIDKMKILLGCIKSYGEIMPETGFAAAFAVYPCSWLVAAEFPDSFTRFVSFAARIAERLDAERAAIPAAPAPANPYPDAPSFGHSGFMQI